MRLVSLVVWHELSIHSPKSTSLDVWSSLTEHESWTDDQWARILFGDETYICLGAHGQIWVQRPQDAAYLSQYMVQGQSNFAPKIGIWACFAGQGVGALRIFDDNMDTRLYTDTMQRFMKPCALRFWPNGAWFYLQDNASYHESHRSRTGSTTME